MLARSLLARSLPARRPIAAAAVAACCGFTALGSPPAPANAAERPKKGQVLAQIEVRRMGLKAEVREGVGQAVLRSAVGHYPGTALPGQEGNTVLFGHRTTWRSPFLDLDKVRRGDRIVLRAGRTSYVYTARSTHVIKPRDRRVLEPVPFVRRSAPDGEYISLITCTPKGSDRYRLVVVGVLHHKKPA
ncbi:class E sortase [Actinomadura sp. GC306]|uniref:class E sortase n=1 Tax=Actinomadura sp. GC306 TaxID=2530367 RepID=UPI001049D157|nr:class E sortase [Actinomadura sp. GC306]TDC59594.1 class E sortase [Actinomadura sp. GC306]